MFEIPLEIELAIPPRKPPDDFFFAIGALHFINLLEDNAKLDAFMLKSSNF